MSKALGLVEFSSIAKGIEAADMMVKKASVEVLKMKHICPGKFMIILMGDIEDVRVSVEALSSDTRKIVESAVISNAHNDLISYFNNNHTAFDSEAIGIFETSTVTSALISLDKSLKSSSVKLLRMYLGNGIGGKSYFIVSGSISDVEEAIKAATNTISHKRLIYKSIIPHPSKDAIKNL